MEERIYQPGLAPQQTFQHRPEIEEDPGWDELLSAGFSQENDMIALSNMMRREPFEADPDFDIQKAVRESPLGLDHFEILGQAQSQEEFDSLSQRIAREQEDRETLAAGGWQGFVAGMTGAVFSPLMFVPLVGQAQGARGVAQAFGLAATVAGTQEGILFRDQLLRTPAESFTGVAGGTVLGGLLGSAAVYLRRPSFERMADDMASGREPEAIAQVVRTPEGQFVRDGGQAPLNMPENFQIPPRVQNELDSVDNILRERSPQLQVRGVEELRRMSQDETLDARVREIAAAAERRFHERSSPRQAALRAGLSEDAAEAWEGVRQAELRAMDQGEDTQAGQMSRQEAQQLEAVLDERLREAGITGESQRLRIRGELRKLPGQHRDAVEALTAARDEYAQAVRDTTAARSQAADRSSQVGAARRGAQHVPHEPIRDPETGQITYVPRTDMTGPGKIADPTFVGRAAGQISPVYRLIQQEVSPALREAQQKLGTGGLAMEGNREGFVAAAGGSAEERINAMVEAGIWKIMKANRQSYAEYAAGPGARTVSQNLGLAWARFTDRRPDPNKLTPREFSAEITRAMNQGDTSEIPEVTKAIKEIRTVYDEVFNYADEVAAEWGVDSIIPALRTGENESYLNHVFDQRKVSENSEQFIQDVSAHIRQTLNQAAERRWQRIREQIDEDESFARVLEMEREEAASFREDLQQRARTLEGQRRENAALDRVEELEEQAREVRRARFEELEENNPMRDPERTAANRRLAREETQEEYDALRGQAAQIRSELPEEQQQLRAELAKTRRQLRQVNASVGRLEAQRAEALVRFEELEQQNLNALDRLTARAQTSMRQLDRLSDDRLDAEVRRLEQQFDRTAAQIDRGEQRMDRLRERFGSEGTEFEPSERLSIEQFRQDQRSVRLERQAEQLDRAVNYDRETARQAIQQRLDDMTQYVNRVNQRRSERMARLRDRVDDMDPQRAREHIAQLRAKGADRMEEFDSWLRDMRATNVHVSGESPRFDFSDEARDLAKKIQHQISGSTGRMAQIDQLETVRGFRKHRMLDLPYSLKRKYLNEDVEAAADIYLRSMIPDLELHRQFGVKNFEDIWRPIQDDMDKYREQLASRTTDQRGRQVTPERRAQELRQFESMQRSYMDQLRGQVDRLRNQRGIPDNPDAITYRIGRTILDWNVSTMMGPAAITSIPDAARSVMAYGMFNTFRDGWTPFIKGLTDHATRNVNRRAVEELKMAGVGVESYTQARATAMLDIYNVQGQQTQFERGMSWAAKMTPKVALFGPQTDINKAIAGRIGLVKMNKAIQRTMEGRGTRADTEYLAKNNLDDRLIRRIWDQLNSEGGGTRFNDDIWPNTEAWTDSDALHAYRSAIKRESDEVIIRPGIERPLWSDENLIGRAVFQFRSFTMAANTRMLMSNLQKRDMALYHAVQGTVFSLAMGALSYYLWAMTTSERAREEMRNASWEEWMDQAIYRSGILGAFSEVQRVGAEIPATRPFTTFADSDLAGRRATSLMGAVAGPSFGKAEDISNFLLGLDEPTQSTVSQARKLMPYQNVFYLRQGLDIVEEGTADLMGLPESRQ